MTAYGTVAQLKMRIQIKKTLTADETTMLEEILDAAARCIENICRVEEGGFASDVVAVARYFTAYGEAYLRIPECTEITEVAVKDSLTDTTYTAWATPSTPMAGDGDWIPCSGLPEHPDYNSLPYNLLLTDLNGDYSVFLDGDAAPVVKVTAKWGPAETAPGDIREANLMQAARWYKRYCAGQSNVLATGELGQILYRKGLDSSVRVILEDGGWITPLYGK